MELRAPEIATLARLRERFLSGANAGGGYWRDEAELALYDATFGERIAWKWDAVIAELGVRGWRPRARHVFDFGCGSGVAGRRVLGAWDGFESLSLADVSQAAVSFSAQKARDEFPNVAVRCESGRIEKGSLLLVSHVINELTPSARDRLFSLVRQADEIIWVEAGTHAESRALIAVREELRGEFGVVAPCTHAERCGMLAEANAPHWCHSFARTPSEVFQDRGWARFSRELGIDITTLPYSYLVMQRGGVPSGDATMRIVGRPREAKGRMEVLCCDAGGVGENTLQKRDEPQLVKALRKGDAGPAQRLCVRAGKLRSM